MEESQKPWAPHEADIIRVKNILTESHQHRYRLFYSQTKRVPLENGMETVESFINERYIDEDTANGFTYVFDSQAEKIPAGGISDLPRGRADMFARQLADFIAGIEYQKTRIPEVDSRGVVIPGAYTGGDATLLTEDYKSSLQSKIILGRVHAENERIDYQRRMSQGARMTLNELPADLRDIAQESPAADFSLPVEPDPSIEDLVPSSSSSKRTDKE